MSVKGRQERLLVIRLQQLFLRFVFILLHDAFLLLCRLLLTIGLKRVKFVRLKK